MDIQYTHGYEKIEKCYNAYCCPPCLACCLLIGPCSGSPVTWFLYAMASDQLGGSDVPFVVQTGQPPQGTVGEFMTTYFGYDYGFRCMLGF